MLLPELDLCKMKMLKPILVLAIVACVAGPSRSQEYSLRTLMMVPPDTAEAQRVRIWIPIEHSASCKVTVGIVDSTGRPVRDIFEHTLAPGYYNLYWDKKDDSGAYVDSGTYTAVINDLCADERRETLTALYAPGELSAIIPAPSLAVSDSLKFRILVDSARVTCDILNRQNRLQQRAMSDSLFSRGNHVFTWQKDMPVSPGLYTARITIDGYTRLCPIRKLRRQY